MDNPVKDLLSQLQREGELDSKSSFTISEQGALLKLAQYQLPSPQAWVLKVIQAAVAAGADEEIRVHQLRDRTELSFTLRQPWSLPGLKRAFTNPEPAAEPGLAQLCQALWSAGLAQRRAIRLEFQGSPEVMIWDGSELSFLTRRSGAQGAYLLCVSHEQKKVEGSSWLAKSTRASRTNADVRTLLRQQAFCCPVRLWLDSYQIQCALALPGEPLELHLPVALHLLDLATPPLDFSRSHMEEPKPSEISPRQLIVPVLRKVKALEPTSGLGLLSLHYQCPLKGSPEPIERPSLCYWVQHGVVVQTDRLTEPHRLSLSYFLCADDLDCDVSGFQLLQSPEYVRRTKLLWEALRSSVESLPVPDLTPWRIITDKARKISGAMMVGVCLILSPVSWPLALGAGAAALWFTGSDSRKLQELESDLPSLMEALQADLSGRSESTRTWGPEL